MLVSVRLPSRCASARPVAPSASVRCRSIVTLLGPAVWLLGLVQLSCAGPYVQTTGVDFDASKLSEFQTLKTTKEEVRTALGDPQELRITDDGLEIWVYRYEVMERMDDGLLSGSGFNALLREKRLEIVFVEGTLRHSTFVDAKSPIERRPSR